MLLRLHVSLLLLWMAGCAAERLIVPEDDWQTVPAAQRAPIDHRHQVELAAAQAELASATAELAAFHRAHPASTAPPPRPTVAPPAAPASDAWDSAVHDQAQARRAAFARVETDNATWLRTDLAWRELHAQTASARLEMVICEREMIRARTIDRNLVGTDSYDSAPVRGQFSRAQVRWYALDKRASQARIAFERASASLASSKEEYAQIMRNGPAQLRSQPAYAEARPAKLELTAWAVQRSDIRRRRGLRHYLDDAALAPAGLRRAKLQLAARAVVLPRPPPDVAASEPPAPSARVEPSKPTVVAEPAKPISKPAVLVVTAKQPPPAATVVARPPAPATTAVAASKPVVATSKPVVAKPAPSATTKSVAVSPPKAAPAATPKPPAAAPLTPTPSKPAVAAVPLFPSPASQAMPSSAKPAEPTDPSSR